MGYVKSCSIAFDSNKTFLIALVVTELLSKVSNVQPRTEHE